MDHNHVHLLPAGSYRPIPSRLTVFRKLVPKYSKKMLRNKQLHQSADSKCTSSSSEVDARERKHVQPRRKFVPVVDNDLCAFKGSPQSTQLLNNFLFNPEWKHLVDVLDVKFEMDGCCAVIDLKLKGGSRIPPAMWKALKLQSVKRELTRSINRTIGMDASQAFDFLSFDREFTRRVQPSAYRKPKGSRHKSAFLRKQEAAFDGAFNAQFKEQSGYDTDYSDFDDVDIMPKIKYFGRFFRRRPRVDLLALQRKSVDTMDLFIGCADALMAFINSFKLGHLAGLTGANLRNHLTLSALEFLRSLLQDVYVHKVLERGLLEFWKFTSHLHRDLQPTREQGFGGEHHDLLKRFMMFVVAYPFMRGAATWAEKKTWFENATTHFYKRGGVSDQSDFVTMGFEFFGWMFKTGAQCFQERSFEPFWRTAESYANWYDDASDAIRIENAVGFEEFDVQSYIERLERLVTQGERVLDVARTSRSPAVPAITRLLGELKDKLFGEELLDYARSSKPTPFFIGLYGAPKTGKTFLIDELLHTFFRIRNEPYQERFKYVKSSTDKFDSGLKTYHKAIIIDDIGTLDSSVEEALAGPRFVMELANSTIAASNQADLRDKGRIFARPEIVMVTSNHTDFGHKGLIRQPAAYLRRIRYRVSLSLKTDFRRGDANFIDEIAVSEYGGPDIHNFNVVEYVITPINDKPEPLRQNGDRVEDPENSNYKVQERIILRNAEQADFFAWYYQAINSHFAHIDSVKLNSEKLAKATLCEMCHMLSTRCECFSPTPSDEEDYPRVLPPQEEAKQLYQERQKNLRKLGFSHDVNGNPLPELVEQGFFTKFRRKVERKVGKVVLDRVVRQQVRELGAAGVSWGDFGKSVFRTARAAISDPNVQAIALRFVAVYLTMRMRRGVIPARDSLESQLDQHLLKQTDAESYKGWIDRLKQEGKDVPLDVYQDRNRTPPVYLSMKVAPFTAQQLSEKVRKNQISLHFPQNQGGMTVCGTGLYDDVVMTVRHAFGDFTKPVKLFFGEFGKTTEVTISARDVVHASWDSDLILFHIRKRQFRDITCFLPKKLNYVTSFTDVDFVHCDDSMCRTFSMISPSLANARTGVVMPKFEANAVMKDGSCGGLLIATTSRKRPFIAGMHHLLARRTQTSLAIPLDLDLIRGGLEHSRARLHRPMRNRFELNGLRQVPSKSYTTKEYHLKSYVNFREFPRVFKPAGSVDYPLLRPRTRIIETPLNGLIPLSNKEIPDMRTGNIDGVYRNFFNDVVDQLCDVRAAYPQALLQRALDKVKDRYTRVFKKASPSHPLDEYHSLNGVDGVRFYDAFKRKTGKGLPKRGPKYDVIDVHGDGSRHYTATARESVQFVAECLAEHINPGVIADICLKDEVKKPGKAVRGFAAMPFPFNDIMRRAALPVFKVVQENAVLFGIAIGTDAESWEWKEIYLKHSSRKNHVLYDFKNFDRSHSEEILKAAHEILFECMSILFSEMDTICGIPWHQVVAGGFAFSSNPVYNVQGTLFEALGSLASGMFHTAVVNSIIQELILQMLWYRFEEINGTYTPEDSSSDRFKANCSNTGYGDDGFVSTDVEGFDLPFFAAQAKAWNLIITDPDKTDPNRKSFPLEMWSFLKRGFEPDSDSLGTFVRAPLEINSVLKTANFYVPNDMPEVDAMVQRVNECVDHLSSHRSDEARELDASLRSAMAQLYGPNVLEQIPSLEKAWASKRGRQNRPSLPNPHNFADRAGLGRAEYESAFYGKQFQPDLAF